MKAIKYFIIFFVICGIFGAIGKVLFPETNQPPKVEKKIETPKIEEKKLSGTDFMTVSRNALQEKTGLPVTDFYMMEYSEGLDANGFVNTHGFAVFNSNGIKRQFWAVFDYNTKEIKRLKIDSQLIFSSVGW